MVHLVSRISDLTVHFAGKRVSRDAKAANIGRSKLPFQSKFVARRQAPLDEIVRVLAAHDLRFPRIKEVAIPLAAQLFHDRWNALYLRFDKDDAMALDARHASVRCDVMHLVTLVFDAGCVVVLPLRNPLTGA
ncbi:MAG: hypothetical protein AB8B51_09375 [Sedimentitalea sp.]